MPPSPSSFLLPRLFLGGKVAKSEMNKEGLHKLQISKSVSNKK
jgi:hypothetical protein